MTYECIIHLGNVRSDYDEFETILYPASSAEDLRRGVLMGSPDREAACAYLRQWDYGEPTEPYDGDGDPWGGGDDVTWFTEDGTLTRDWASVAYVMSYHTGLSYASLYRVLPR